MLQGLRTIADPLEAPLSTLSEIPVSCHFLFCVGTGVPARSVDQRDSLAKMKQASMRQRKEEIIDAKSKGFGGRLQRVAGLVDPLPEIADVVIVIDNH